MVHFSKVWKSEILLLVSLTEIFLDKVLININCWNWCKLYSYLQRYILRLFHKKRCFWHMQIWSGLEKIRQIQFHHLLSRQYRYFKCAKMVCEQLTSFLWLIVWTFQSDFLIHNFVPTTYDCLLNSFEFFDTWLALPIFFGNWASSKNVFIFVLTSAKLCTATPMLYMKSRRVFEFRLRSRWKGETPNFPVTDDL